MFIFLCMILHITNNNGYEDVFTSTKKHHAEDVGLAKPAQ